MPLPPHDPAAVRAAFAAKGAAFIAAEGGDVDEAFDACVGAAYNDPAADTVFTTVDPATVTVVGEPDSFDACVAAALAWAETAEPGTVGAFAVLPRSAHARVTRRARVEGVEFEVDQSPAGPWVGLDADLAAAVAAAAAGPVDGEALERVQVTRRARYKPVATSHKGASKAEHVAICGNRVITRGHPTATVARRAAADLIKAMPAEDHSPALIEVYRLVGRDEGRPLAQVERTRVRQVLSLKLTYATRKETTRPVKTAGWLFATPHR